MEQSDRNEKKQSKDGMVYWHFLLVLLISVTMPATASAAFKIHKSYEVRYVKTIESAQGEKLFLEKTWADDDLVGPVGIMRFQIRREGGSVAAYTGTRVSGFPVCPHRNYCWVFMWKTVYAFPAVYKFNADGQDWIHDRNPPMQYSRSGYAYKGFTESYNPFLMAFGIAVFMFKYAWYFSICVLFSIIMCLQIAKYRDLPEQMQKWIRQALMLVFLPTKILFPVEPYLITAVVIFVWVSVGVGYFGVPLVLTAVVVMSSFLLCALRLGEIKKNKRK